MACDVGTELFILVESDENGVTVNVTVHLTDTTARSYAESLQPSGVTIEWLDAPIVGNDSAGYTVGLHRKRYYHVQSHLLRA